MNFEIESYHGAGPIELGMKREEVRRILNVPSESFMKSSTSVAAAEAFDSLGIHVHFDSKDHAEAIEFYGLSSNPTFRGRQLLAQPFTEIEKWLRSLDHNLQVDSTGLTSFACGLGVYAPSHTHDRSSQVEGVIVFRKGYYDDTHPI